jgi:mannose-6-phosphate isomerase
MAIELARTHALSKPWGVADLGPWSKASTDDGRLVGEIWYERLREGTPEPSLLLKLLFTSQPLSIQVHPDDAYAQSMGLTCGKSEAWYILSAMPGARIALGLKERLAPRQLREAVDDGTIVRHIAWRTVLAGDVVSVPAGTIHAIGAGLVIAEIQQRSDATFRIFDFGRKRELHLANAVAVADTGPVEAGLKPRRLTDERTLLVSNPHFAFERIELVPGSTFCLQAERETWLVVIGGSARAGKFGVATGDAVFAQFDSVDLQAGPDGMVGLVAYAKAGGPDARRGAKQNTSDAGEPEYAETLQ